MISSTGAVQTPLAGRYLKQLCKHFSLEIPVEYSENQAQAQFPFGQCWMQVEHEVLTFHCRAENSDHLAQLQTVITAYLDMFTKNNPQTITWRDPDDN